MPSITLPGPLPATPPNSPTVPPVQNTPDSSYSDGGDTDSTFTLDSVIEEGILKNGRTYHTYNAGRKYLSSTNTL